MLFAVANSAYREPLHGRWDPRVSTYRESYGGRPVSSGVWTWLVTVISWFKKFSLQFSVCILDNVLLSMYQRRALDNTRSLYIFLTQSPSFRQDIVIATKTDINKAFDTWYIALVSNSFPCLYWIIRFFHVDPQSALVRFKKLIESTTTICLRLTRAYIVKWDFGKISSTDLRPPALTQSEGGSEPGGWLWRSRETDEKFWNKRITMNDISLYAN